MRDPRKYPVPGDVITRFGTTREVTATKQNNRGTVTHVVYRHPEVDLPETVATIASWRAWAKLDAMVVRAVWQLAPPLNASRNSGSGGAAIGIKRVEVALSERERQQLDHLRIARAGSGEPYSADEYISTLIRRDWELWLEQEAELNQQICPNCDCALPEGCGGTFKGEAECWLTQGDKTIAL